METHDLGRLFWHTQDRDTHLPVQIARSQMTEEPYRRGLGLALAPFTTRALIVGYWGRKTGPMGIRVIGDKTKKVRKWAGQGRPTPGPTMGRPDDTTEEFLRNARATWSDIDKVERAL
jgi:hypothetical protein